MPPHVGPMNPHIVNSRLAPVEIPATSLGAYVLDSAASIARASADKPIIIDGDTGAAWSYEKFIDFVARLAGGLREHGVSHGSVVALIAPNSPEFVIAFHAIARLGATVTTINPQYSSAEINAQLLDCKPELAFCADNCLPALIQAEASKNLAQIVSLPGADVHNTNTGIQTGTTEQAPATLDSTTPVTTFSSLLGDTIDQQALDPESTICVLPYSSGTTGIPKGVMLSHTNLVANTIQTNAAQNYSNDESALAVLPFFHIYGMQVLMNCLLAAGVTIVTMRRFDMEGALSLIQKHQITRFFAVPPIVLGFAKHPAVEKYNIESLRQVFSGAAPLGGELANEASKRIGCPVVQGYGMTELSPVTHLTVGSDYKSGSSGVAIANTESRIVAEDGNDVAPGEVGELWIRGPQVMKGYLGNDRATADCLDKDGWLRTGDLSRIDEDGHMFIVDRLKELIKYKGFQIAPAELEALIISFPEIADVAVIGVTDEESGEVPKAYVQLQPGQSLSAEQLKTRLEPELASYKRLHFVEFVDSIPKSASGKILRRLLRQQSNQ